MEVYRRGFKLIFSLVMMIIIFASAILEVENENIRLNKDRVYAIPKDQRSKWDFYLPDRPYEFHEMLYYMVVTMTTVGYGDIFPLTDIGRMLCAAIVFLMLALLPAQSQALVKVLSLTSKYARDSYKKSKKD